MAEADSTMDGLSMETTEDSILIQKINHEREIIWQALQEPQINYPVPIPVHKKYFLADNASLQLLQTAEGMDPILEYGTRPSLMESLKLEVDALGADLTTAVEIMENKHKKIDRLEQRISDLKEMETFSKDDLINSSNINMVEQRIKEEFLKEKKELKIVLAEVFPEDIDLRNIIAEVIRTNLDNTDAYTEIESPEKLTLLIKTGMFELHPTDPKLIRMVDLS